jgi:hypothetical protein
MNLKSWFNLDSNWLTSCLHFVYRQFGRCLSRSGVSSWRTRRAVHTYNSIRPPPFSYSNPSEAWRPIRPRKFKNEWNALCIHPRNDWHLSKDAASTAHQREILRWNQTNESSHCLLVFQVICACASLRIQILYYSGIRLLDIRIQDTFGFRTRSRQVSVNGIQAY